ncbi:hypothetical protein [Nonomuraea soli]|uniref:Uncharacterized protein n=1 Tax=Nonomuraea soli TaxID=1032476 RepID=A0A7W0HSF8_9ACTN|nr:hypothetical protein [Nonomuraea soli]MBA2894038.1 hypothetical protein [Nonomuraea soli]
MARFIAQATAIAQAGTQAGLAITDTHDSQGPLLREILAKTGGAYMLSIPVSPEFRTALAATTTEQTVEVSLEHLRGMDPNTTRVVIRVGLDPSDRT